MNSKIMPNKDTEGYWVNDHEDAQKAGKDFYIDSKTGLTVFTQNYHLEKGYCCESGCRHCPYGFVVKSR